TSYTETNLVSGNYYRFRVRAFNGSGGSAWLNSPGDIQTDTTVPIAPSNLVITSNTASTISLSWADNSDNEDNFEVQMCSGYNCTSFGGLTGNVVGAGVTSLTRTGLTEGSTYRFRVRANNATGSSGWSAVSANAYAFRGITLADNVASNRIRVNWNAATNAV